MAEFVLTLIAAEAMLTEAAVAAAAAALGNLGARLRGPVWLAAGTACDLPFDDLAPDQAQAAARAALLRQAVDLVAQPAEGRRKRLLLADMEATIIGNEMLEEIAAALGLRDRVAAITRRAMNGEIDFVAALKQRMALLEGLPESALDEAGARIRVTPGAATLVATMRAQGAHAVLVSGGFSLYAQRIRAELGFDDALANEIEILGGRLTGKVREPILGQDAKLAALKRFAAELGLPLAATLAVGDGANDLPMIEAAGLGIAYHGKPAVAARARNRVDHADLTALLYAQGYRSDEFVARG